MALQQISWGTDPQELTLSDCGEYVEFQVNVCTGLAIKTVVSVSIPLCDFEGMDEKGVSMLLEEEAREAWQQEIEWGYDDSPEKVLEFLKDRGGDS